LPVDISLVYLMSTVVIFCRFTKAVSFLRESYLAVFQHISSAACISKTLSHITAGLNVFLRVCIRGLHGPTFSALSGPSHTDPAWLLSLSKN